MQAVLHDGDELRVAEVAVPVRVEDLEDRVDHVGAQRESRAHLDRALELFCREKHKQNEVVIVDTTSVSNYSHFYFRILFYY